MGGTPAAGIKKDVTGKKGRAIHRQENEVGSDVQQRSHKGGEKKEGQRGVLRPPPPQCVCDLNLPMLKFPETRPEEAHSARPWKRERRPQRSEKECERLGGREKRSISSEKRNVGNG